MTNALRAHLGEFGIIVTKGMHNAGRLLTMAEAANLPESARSPIRLIAEQFRDTESLRVQLEAYLVA